MHHHVSSLRGASFVVRVAMRIAYFAPFYWLAADAGVHASIGYNDVIALFHGHWRLEAAMQSGHPRFTCIAAMKLSQCSKT
jgi:hypothetical protein